MKQISAFVIGLLFGIGLIVSGMSNPAKVLGFLDLAGLWDPSLAFVMGGAVSIGLVAFGYARRLQASLLGNVLRMPVATRIDRRLVAGSVLFGIGWGLAGICPGPGLVLIGTGAPEGMLFVAAMLVGMAIFEFRERRAQRASTGLGAAGAK